MKELTFALFSATQPSSIPFELRNGDRDYVATIAAVVKMVRQLKDDEIKKLSISLEQLMKTNLYYVFIIYIGFMFSLSPMNNEDY